MVLQKMSINIKINLFKIESKISKVKHHRSKINKKINFKKEKLRRFLKLNKLKRKQISELQKLGRLTKATSHVHAKSV